MTLYQFATKIVKDRIDLFSQTEIFVDHIMEWETKFGQKAMCTDFIGIVEEPYLKDFVRFLEEEGIKIHQE